MQDGEVEGSQTDPIVRGGENAITHAVRGGHLRDVRQRFILVLGRERERAIPVVGRIASVKQGSRRRAHNGVAKVIQVGRDGQGWGRAARLAA